MPIYRKFEKQDRCEYYEYTATQENLFEGKLNMHVTRVAAVTQFTLSSKQIDGSKQFLKICLLNFVHKILFNVKMFNALVIFLLFKYRNILYFSKTTNYNSSSYLNA